MKQLRENKITEYLEAKKNFEKDYIGIVLLVNILDARCPQIIKHPDAQSRIGKFLQIIFYQE